MSKVQTPKGKSIAALRAAMDWCGKMAAEDDEAAGALMQQMGEALGALQSEPAPLIEVAVEIEGGVLQAARASHEHVTLHLVDWDNLADDTERQGELVAEGVLVLTGEERPELNVERFPYGIW